VPKRILEEKVIPIPKVKELLESMDEDELDPFQRRTLDYAVKFSKINADKAEGLIADLIRSYSLEREIAVQLVNCMPSSVEELRAFFLAGKRKILASSQLEQILKLIDGYRERQ